MDKVHDFNGLEVEYGDIVVVVRSTDKCFYKKGAIGEVVGSCKNDLKVHFYGGRFLPYNNMTNDYWFVPSSDVVSIVMSRKEVT